MRFFDSNGFAFGDVDLAVEALDGAKIVRVFNDEGWLRFDLEDGRWIVLSAENGASLECEVRHSAALEQPPA